MSVVKPCIDDLLEKTDHNRFLLASLASKRACDINSMLRGQHNRVLAVQDVDDITIGLSGADTISMAMDEIVDGDISYDEARYEKVRMVIDGGAERCDSTMAALNVLKQAGIPQQAKILIHDAVRPFVSQESIDDSIDTLDEFSAATVAFASTDTILLTHDAGDRKVIGSVPDRADTFRAQTPQSFRFGTIYHAYELAADDPDFHPTDDTRVVVDYLPDESVAIVAGSDTNLKVTTMADLPIAERIAANATHRLTKEEARARMHAILREAVAH